MPFWIFEKRFVMKHIPFLFTIALLSAGTVKAQQNVPPPPPLVVDSTLGENTIFTKVDVEAGFPGGQPGWVQYLQKNLRIARIADEIKFPRGKKEFKQTVIVRFIVNKEGYISDVAAENNDADPLCIAEAIRVIRVSPNWIPAQQNGRKVNAYRRQPITFVFER